MDRRRFLIGAATTAGATALMGCNKGTTDDTAGPEGSPARDPEPAEWSPPGDLDPAAFAWSVQSGDVTAESALLSVHTTESSVDLTLMQADGDTWTTVAAQGGEVVDGFLQVEVTGLSPDTAYRFIFVGQSGRSEVGRFRTALAEGQDREIVFGASSCLGRTNAPWPTLSQAGADQLDFFLLLGDTVYADGSVSSEDYLAVWEEALATQGLYDLTAGTSVVATWDDHEVDNNWELDDGTTQDQIDAALDLFRKCIPQRDTDGAMWRTLKWGATLELFVLDCRGERGAGWTQMISEEQMAWFKAALSASTARFKVVMVSVQVTDWSPVLASVSQSDRWSGYPDQRQELLSHCEGIEGVLFVTGDMHFGALTYVGQTGDVGEGLMEVMAGPAGSTMNTVPSLYQGDREQFPVLLAGAEDWSWCRFTANAGLGEIRVEFLGDDGSTLAEETLSL